MMSVNMKNVCKTISNNKILKQVNLKIEEQEFVSIMGPSGSGKSTLLNIISGLDNNYTGQVFLGSQEISKLKEKEKIAFRRDHIGIIFQELNLIPTMSVRNNLIIPLVFQNKLKEANKRIEEALYWVNMDGRQDETCQHLSGGEKQRIAIARAIIARPDIILADEPTGALDSNNGKDIMELLKACNEEKKATIILVTHDKNWASYADRIVHIQDGMIQ